MVYKLPLRSQAFSSNIYSTINYGDITLFITHKITLTILHKIHLITQCLAIFKLISTQPKLVSSSLSWSSNVTSKVPLASGGTNTE